jgi:signal transduction protein with GAF and PtsI domain
MSAQGESGQADTLAEAQATIERQAAEIAQLQRRLADQRFAEQLREALTLAVSAGTVAAPVKHTRLLEMIVKAGAHVIGAQAAALFLIDEESQELIFEVALGQQAEQVKKFRVPLGHGIAGLVAVSGQPMSVADAQNDTRQASDIAQSVGYIPKNILCVPLFFEDQVIGVLELLDKQGAPSFTIADMEILGLFANIAAVAIEQSRIYNNLPGLIRGVIETTIQDGERQHLQQKSAAFAAGLEQDTAYQQAISLAQLVREIVWQGEREADACQQILKSFAEYLQLRPQVSTMVGAL